MALVGKQKAVALFKLVESASKEILNYLPGEDVIKLNSLMDEDIELTPEVVSQIFQEIEKEKQNNSNQNLKNKAQKNSLSTFGGNTLDFNMASEKNSSFFGDDEPESIPEVQSKPGELRSDKNIVKILTTQRPQIIAFLLSKIDEERSETLYALLPSDIRKEVDAISINKVPLSRTVFDQLYKEVFIAKDEESETQLFEELSKNKSEEENSETEIRDGFQLNETETSLEDTGNSFNFSMNSEAESFSPIGGFESFTSPKEES